MTPESQRTHLRLMQPLQRREQPGQLTSSPQQEPQQEKAQPRSYQEYLTQTGGRYVPIIYGKPPSQAEREYVTKTYKEYLDKTCTFLNDPAKAYLIEQELMGNTPPPIILQGREVSGLEYWNYLQEKREREKQEAITRGEFPDIHHPAPLVQQQLRFDETIPLTPGQRNERNRSIFSALRGRLVTEIKNEEIDLIAENIRSDMWRYGRLTHIKPTVKGEVTIHDNGIIKNRLQTGLTLSYPLLDGRNPKTPLDKKQELTFGIGYFGDRTNLIPEAQGVVSDGDLQKGIKAYFIRRTFFDKVTLEKKTYLTVIPFAFASSQQTFYEHLADSAIFLDQRNFVSRRSTRRYLKTHQAAV